MRRADGHSDGTFPLVGSMSKVLLASEITDPHSSSFIAAIALLLNKAGMGHISRP